MMTDYEAIDLRGLTRDELNAVAGELGIAEAAELTNKGEVIAAIEAAMTAHAAAEASAPPAPSGTAAPQHMRFHALKGFTMGDGRVIMPGDVFDPGDGSDWPPRRLKQMEEQHYIRPMS